MGLKTEEHEMQVDLITRAEFEQFKTELFLKMEALLQAPAPKVTEGWMKSGAVKQVLQCADATLARMRVQKKIEFRKMGGTYYYKLPD
jgi:hypothetical protein